MLLSMGLSLPLALHWGDLQSVGSAYDRLLDVVPRMLAEPNQVPERPTTLWLNCFPWPWMLGKGRQMATVIADCCGSSWSAIDAWCDAFTADSDNNPYFAPRGQAPTVYSGVAGLPADGSCPPLLSASEGPRPFRPAGSALPACP